MFELSFLEYLVIASLLLALIGFNRSSYWKAKYETLDEERDKDSDSGWREEARFLRQLVNKEAADKTIEIEEEHW